MRRPDMPFGANFVVTRIGMNLLFFYLFPTHTSAITTTYSIGTPDTGYGQCLRIDINIITHTVAESSHVRCSAAVSELLKQEDFRGICSPNPNKSSIRYFFFFLSSGGWGKIKL